LAISRRFLLVFGSCCFLFFVAFSGLLWLFDGLPMASSLASPGQI
jgi:hypothetical protein